MRARDSGRDSFMVEGRFYYREASRYYLAAMGLNLPVLLGFTLCCTVGLAQVDRQFADQLVRQTVVLRNFYTGKKLKYDANGVPISGGAAGSGPADGRVYVEALKLEKDKVIIRGERPISVFNPGTGESSLFGLHDKVEIEADLPSDKGASEAATEMLHRIFLTPAESDRLACSANEENIFRERMLAANDIVSVPKGGKQNNGEPRQLCFPGGDRAYVAGNGVAPPKALKTPDPAYPLSVLHTKEASANPPATQENRVVLALIVDSRGEPTSQVVIGAFSSLTVFDLAVIDAVHAWKFQPATYQGKPVPAAITVEVNFRLREGCGDLCLGYPQGLLSRVQTTLTLE